jgi:capping protein (actin filament) muscle Z-line, beta
MVEDMEYRLRSTLETIYFGKTKDIANELRQAFGAGELKKRQGLQQEIQRSLNK